MPALNNIARVATKPIPRLISPRVQPIADYATAGSFLAAAGWLWRRNKRAAIASLLCGGAKLAISLLTDYPGGVRRVINLHTRREIDFGLATMVATMPEFFTFEKEPERNFFIAEGVVITVMTELAQFPEQTTRAKERPRAA